jgi:hypothetical protein
MMEAARTSETLVNFYQTTRRYNPEDSHLNILIIYKKEAFIIELMNSLFWKFLFNQNSPYDDLIHHCRKKMS